MRPQAVQSGSSARRAPGPGNGPERLLRRFVATCSFVRQASLFAGDGACRASVGGGDEQAAAVHDSVGSYPRPGLNRLMIRTDLGLVLVSALSEGGHLVVLTDDEVRLGAAWMKVDRLLRDLRETGDDGAASARG